MNTLPTSLKKRSQKSKPSISFFCPAYNDEKNLPILIPKVVKLLKTVASQFEVVIIDDASPDNTGVVADMLASQFKGKVRVVHHTQNKDYGGAIKSGFLNVKPYDFILYTDGDNQYDILELKSMLSFIPKTDAVFGYRKNRSLTPSRLFQSSFYNTLVHILFPIDIRDVGCAFRIIRSKLIDPLSLTSTSAFIQVEIVLALKKKNATIKQIPVTHYPRTHGKASGGKPKVILNTIKDLVRVYLQKILIGQ